MDGNGQIPDVQLVITYNQLKGIGVGGVAVENEMLSVWLLEKAKDAIKEYAREKAKSGIVGATSMPAMPRPM